MRDSAYALTIRQFESRFPECKSVVGRNSFDRLVRGAMTTSNLMAATKVLIIEDDPNIVDLIRSNLVVRGFDTVVSLGTNVPALLEAEQPDMVLLDLMLPEADGFELCRQIRERSTVAIIVVSARGGEQDKVTALNMGADDYMTKPFGAEELLARIRVALRRVADADAPDVDRVQAGDLTIDYARRRVVRGDEEIRLTPKEFELLALLTRNADRVLTHRAILKTIWGSNAVNQPEHLWVLIAQLRKKIEPDPSAPRYLISEPWVGYRFATEPPA
jgi:two-component system KDP operon response regulator KdpE